MMKPSGIMIIFLDIIIIASMMHNGEAGSVADHDIAKRQSVSSPAVTCDNSNEGESFYNAAHPDIIWICKSKEWTLHKLSPSANSCNEIKQHPATYSNVPVNNGVYMVQSMKVYCDMSELDGGGWTLVWQHSYMEDLPLKFSMRYFSEDYTPCVTRASGWCNIPNKARFNPTEQMIVAYHEGTVVYAYKGLFNRNIDRNWSGAILLDFQKIVDHCTAMNGVQPAPENNIAIGLTFDKWSPYDYKANCDTYKGTFASPGDCRWENCHLPSSISSSQYHVQMTVAIYVR